MHAFALVFVICAAGSAEPCEEGIIRARSCAAAEHAIRVGLQPHQTLAILDCARRP